MEEVKLIGAWPSPYVYRVIWALELKGIKYEYVQEDLANKKSTIILEYIDETWPLNHRLLPQDPHQRALVRFWAKFIDDKGMEFAAFYLAVGEEEKEKAAKSVREILRTIEEQALGEKKFLGGDEIGLADLAIGVIAKSIGVIEEIVGVKVLEENEFPRLRNWVKNFKQNPAIKNNLPDPDEMLAYYKKKKEMLVESITA
ncbi:S-crystallin [Parasponia andersonii]|uniref:glutathione transferase n=1 Tax=Parasponia andersonii TaxID=3476 RepID=A0A2P5AL00_PARAD|nr:S-crystallin [Parasponia andersonii]